MKLEISILFVLLWFAAACGGANPSTNMGTGETVASQDPMLKKGQKVYRAHCMACHQKEGTGVLRMNPPLIQTEWVLGDKARLIGIILNGFEGEIEVDGVTYNSIMNSFSYLSDEEISALLTYVRQSFGNDASPVTSDEVAAVRKP
ncbi:cytochrome c [Reichenbachiella sp. 5M10]|uniref:c-type cytochrome n=1 Tax=Reichenbachiella sp. 5M10 TaxID=1889772 RepID=UPI0013041DC2|nr:cytochrome c [Reichenbachiella sp. 5M10]